METSTAAPARARALSAFFRLLFLDIRQASVVIRNAYRHDRRLAESLPDEATQKGSIAGLAAMLHLLEQQITESVEAPLGRLLEQVETTPVEHLLAARAEVGERLTDALKRGAPVHRQFRGLLMSGAPDLRQAEAPLLRLDARPTRAVVQLATEYARVLAAWTASRPCCDPKLQVAVASDSVFDSTIRNGYHLLEDPQTEQIHSIHISLVLPSWLIFFPRYAPMTAHEVAHAFVDLLIERDEAIRQAFDAGVRELRRVTAGEIAPTGRPIEEAALREILCDAFGLAAAGPAFLPTLALLGTGIRQVESEAIVWPPLSVRLSILQALVRADVRATPALPRLREAIALQTEHEYRRRIEQNARFQSVHEDVAAIAHRAVREILDLMGPVPVLDAAPVEPARVRRLLERTLGVDEAPVNESWAKEVADLPDYALSDGGARAVPLLLWELVDRRFLEAKALELDLQGLPEGGIAVALSTLSQPGCVTLGEPWELTTGSFTKPLAGLSPRVAEWLPAIAEAFPAPRPRRHGDDRGLVALALGAADLVELRRGFRWRRPDDVIDAPFPFQGGYGRRGLLPIECVESPDGETIYVHHPVDAGFARPAALTELRLGGENASMLAFFEAVQRADVIRDGSASIAAAFQGLSWADVLVVWSLNDSEALLRLHQEVLAPPEGTLVQRSVTLLLTHVLPLRDGASVSTPWGAPSGAVCARAGHQTGPALDVAMRACDAGRIGKVVDRLRSRASRIAKVYGVADAVATFPVASGSDVTDVAEALWACRVDGLLARSISYYSLPPET